MAEEIITQEGVKPNEETQVSQLTPIEMKAMEAGWVPEAEWNGDADQWRPAKEFLDRGELFKKIEDQNRTMKDMKRALDDMKQLHSRTREVEYARALASLKNQKKQALEEGNADAVIKLDDDIALVREEQTKFVNTPPQNIETPQEFTNWVEKNKWYETDPGMRGYADSLGRSLGVKGMSPIEVLQEVEKEVRKEFPHKFTNPNRNKPGSVEGSIKSGKSTENYVLSDIERQVMQRLVRTGTMTEKEYIASLKNYKTGV
jgi:hypothetical protein